MPQELIGLLLKHRVRVIDIFRQMDDDEDGVVTPNEFAKGIRGLGHDVPMEQISALFSQMDIDGSGTLDYNELHRMLRVGKAAENSRYLRRSVSGYRGYLPGPKKEGPRVAPRLASTLARRLSASDRAAVSAGAPEAAAVEEELWPQGLRQMLLRERMRVLDVFRHWEGAADEEELHGGTISVEDFKAGLRVLGLEASRRDLRQLFSAMGVPEDGSLPFRELRRQLRVVSQRGTSHYLRQAVQQGKQLEASSQPGATLSGVEQLRREQGQQDSPSSAADELAASLWMSETPGTPRDGGDGTLRGGNVAGISLLSATSSPALAAISGMGMGSRVNIFGDPGTVQLGAAATSAKKRALAAAESAAAVTQSGHDSLLSAEMSVQQWARAHYSVLLPELRKWELLPNGEIGFEHFADTLQSLGFVTTGRWQELQQVWESWQPSERGTLHWQRVRALMTGGRMVKVQHKKHTTKQYFKQPSRAGEGFGNRSAPRFREDAHSLLGPGKYQPELCKAGGRADAQRSVKAGVPTHSGKLLHTEQRFKEDKKGSSPAPGSYKPRYTLTESRHNIT